MHRLEWRASPAGRYNRNATVSNSDFSFIGGNAVVAWGCAQRPLASRPGCWGAPDAVYVRF